MTDYFDDKGSEPCDNRPVSLKDDSLEEEFAKPFIDFVEENEAARGATALHPWRSPWHRVAG